MATRPSMTRQHFALIAEVVKDFQPPSGAAAGYNTIHPSGKPAMEQATQDIRRAMARDFARALKGTNSGFQEDKFLHACGVE